MAFDYDLVVIGSTREGIYAAHKAVLLKARVALVTQTVGNYLDASFFLDGFCLGHIVNHLAQVEKVTWGLLDETRVQQQLSLEEIFQDIKTIRESIYNTESLEDLAFNGVDVIYGKGEFCRLPKQAFIVNNRRLISRNYLLATGGKYTLPKILENQAEHPNLLTPEQFFQHDIEALHKKIVLVGDSFRSIELAQILARLEYQIIYVTANKRILPGENVAVNRLFAAQLNADGIKILTKSPLQQVKTIEEGFSLQVGERSLEATQVIFAHVLQPNIEELNLESIGVKYSKRGVIVNNKLQTSNHSIYACGNLLGGNSSLHLAQYEVNIALKNTLSFSWFERHYQNIPITMFTQPNLARIGLTQIPLKAIKKGKIHLIKEYYQNLANAQVTGETTGWCELVLQSNGKILGATIVGDQAIELINIIALMIQHNIKLSANPIKGLLSQDIPYTAPGYSEILNKLAISFQQEKIQKNKSLKNRLTTWFDWRK